MSARGDPADGGRPSPASPNDAPTAGDGAPGSYDTDEAATPEQLRYARRVLSVVSLTTIVTVLTNGTLNIALPHVVRHFDASPVESSWILLSSMLTTGTLIVLFGRLADMFGRRGIYRTGLIVLTVSSFLAGLAPNVEILILLRVVQAIGSAMLLANLAAMLVLVYPPDRLSKAMGIYMAAMASAQLGGPSFGGLLAEVAGWRWVFWFAVPISLACIAWSMIVLKPMPPQGERGRIDIPGSVLVAVTLGSLLLGLSQLQETGLGSPLVIGGFVVFVAAFALFIAVEKRSKSPLIDLVLFRRRSFAMANAAMFLGMMSRMAMLLLTGLYFQAVEGDDAFTAGLKVLPLPIATAAASFVTGYLSRFGSERAIATASTVVAGGGLVLMIVAFATGGSYALIATGLVVIGLGGGVFLPANTTAILQETPKHRLGVVNAVRMMLMNAGTMVATALSLTLITSTLAPDLRQQVFAGRVSQVSAEAVDALTNGYIRATVVLLALSLLGTLACVLSQRAAARMAPLPEEPDAPDARDAPEPPPGAVTTRLAAPADVPVVVELARRTYSPYVERIGREPAPMRADYATLVAGERVWVAEFGGAVCGVLVLRDDTDHLLLESLAVDPDRRRHGVGRALLELAEARARDAGLGEVRVLTSEAMTESLGYYPRLGYVETQRGETAGADTTGPRRVVFSKSVEPEPAG